MSAAAVCAPAEVACATMITAAAAREVVNPATHASRSRNSPFAGLDLPGRVVATFLRGAPTVLDGKIA